VHAPAGADLHDAASDAHVLDPRAGEHGRPRRLRLGRQPAIERGPIEDGDLLARAPKGRRGAQRGDQQTG
jgi:hypothetical protein